MVPFSVYFAQKIIPFFISVISTTLVFGFIYIDVSLILKKKPKFRALLFAALVTAVIFHIPQFAVEYLFYYPVAHNTLADNLLLYPNPFYIFPYYWILHSILKFPKADAMRSLEELTTAQFISLLLFRAISSGWAAILQPQDSWPATFHTDFLSMVTMVLLGLLCMFCVKFFMYKTKRQFDTPHDYPLSASWHGFGRIFMSVSYQYIILILFGLLILDRRQDSIYLNQGLIYFILIALLAYRMNENIRKRRISMLEWQRNTTNEYVQSLIAAGDAFREVRHDINNILQVYGGYIATNDLESLRQYHNTIVKTAARSNRTIRLSESLRQRTAIVALLNLKLQNADQLDVHVEIGQLDDLATVEMHELDLCRALEGLLDYTIGAAAQSTDKYVHLSCRRIDENHVDVELINSIDRNAVLPEIESQKKEHKDQGLYATKRIIAAHQDCRLQIKHSANRLFIELILKTTEPATIVL